MIQVFKRLIIIFIIVQQITEVSFSQTFEGRKQKLDKLIQRLSLSAQNSKPIDKLLLDEAFAIAENNISKYPILLQLKGVFFFQKRNTILAKKYLELAEENFKTPEDDFLIARNDLCFSYLNAQINNYEKAEYYCKIALEKFKNLNKLNYIRIAEIYKIQIELKKGNNEKVAELLKGLDKNTHELSINTQAKCVYFLLNTYLILNDLKSASKYINNESLLKILKDSNTVSENLYYINCLTYYSLLKDRKKVDSYVKKSIKLFKEDVSKTYYDYGYQSYSIAYRNLGDYKLAAVYNDTLLKFINDNKNVLEKSSFNLQDEQNKYRVVVEDIKRERKIRISLLVILLLISLFVVYYYRKKFNFLNVKNKKLETKNQFLEENYKKLLSHYKISSEKLKSIYTHLNKASVNKENDTIKQTLRELNIFMSNDSSETVLYINELQENFALELKEKCSELSDIELHVCFLIKMSLTAVEIGDVLKKSKRSIESIKYRIRKKISVETNLTLEEILDEIKIHQNLNINS